MTLHGCKQTNTEVLIELTFKYTKDVKCDVWCCFEIPQMGERNLKKKKKGVDGTSDANVAKV